MRAPMWVVTLLAAVSIAGCNDATAPRDHSPPAVPRGVASVTGDHVVYMHWLPNSEGDLAGYRVYASSCFDCDYDPVGVTSGTDFTVTGLSNGVTRYYAVAAFDRTGNESELSYDDVFDTPRPEGYGRSLTDAGAVPATSGWDFSAIAVRPVDDPLTDVYYLRSGSSDQMVAPFTDTDLQDAGYTNTLDGVDFAPVAGWSPTGIVELIVGHSYVVRTPGDRYAKFRVTQVGSGSVVFDWAFQTDPGNRELHSRRVTEGPRVRRVVAPAP